MSSSSGFSAASEDAVDVAHAVHHDSGVSPANLSAGQPLVVWCISDGRSGHSNKTRGLVEALRALTPVDDHWMTVNLRTKPLRRLLRYSLNGAPRTHRHWIEVLYRHRLPQLQPDLIVSTGGNTSFLNIALGTRFRCQNWFIGSLRGLHSRHFDLAFSLESTGAANNVVMAVSPSPFSQKQLEEAAQPVHSRHWGRLRCALIGGNNREYRYSEDEWRALAWTMNAMAGEHGFRWLLTTSPRTGAAVEGILESELDASAIAEATWFSRDPARVMPAYLGAAERFYCTEDSMSMLGEAIHTGKPVHALRPCDHHPDQRYENAIDKLVTQGWIQRVPIGEIGATEGVLPQAGLFRNPRQLLSHQLQQAAAFIPSVEEGVREGNGVPKGESAFFEPDEI